MPHFSESELSPLSPRNSKKQKMVLSNSKKMIAVYDDPKTPLNFVSHLLDHKPTDLIIFIEGLKVLISNHLYKIEPHNLRRLQKACEELADKIKDYMED